MTIDARWAVFTEDGSERGAAMLVCDDDAVSKLVDELSDPMADLARLIHRNRALWDETRKLLDHHVYTTVVDGWGYLSYQDKNHVKAYAVGEASSPGCEFEDDEFPPGSGLPLTTFKAALAEWLHTSQRPTVVQWRELESAE